MPVKVVEATGPKCPKPGCEHRLVRPGRFYGHCPEHKTVEIRQVAADADTSCAKGGATSAAKQ